MNYGFWKKLKKPIMALAPMADVTDFAFREIIAECGKPDVIWTEFVSVDGLCSKGRERLLLDLKFSQKQRPIIAQIFGSNPDNFKKVAELINQLEFDGIDINMGCPDRKVEKQKSGAALIKNPELAKEIINATKEGAGKIPVSVKTRIGYKENELETWLPHLFETEPALITIHARTRSEMSKVPARWECISQAVLLRDKYFKKDGPFILGNGDCLTIEDAKEKIKKTGADGVMFGRAIFGNPWLFSNKKNISEKEKIDALIHHIELFENTLIPFKSFDHMKKHMKAYITGFYDSKILRIRLMESKSALEAKNILLNEKLLRTE